MKIISSILLAASMMFTASLATAETASTSQKAVSKASKKAKSKVEEEPAPDIKDSIVSEYNCDDGHKITVYRHTVDSQNVAMRWNNKLYRMQRVETESGAERLEQQRTGLVFIGIPAKAMLLDAKKGRQLANECKLPGQ